MKFERSKVVDALCDNLKQWVNWKGVVSDNLKNLKEIVENIHSEDNVKYKVVDVDTQSSTPFMTDRGLYWQFFYPVEPPKKKKFVPFSDSKEMIESYLGYTPKDGMPLIWVKHKEIGYNVLITGYNKGFVFIEDGWKRMWELLDEYTFLEGTPIGKEKE